MSTHMLRDGEQENDTYDQQRPLFAAIAESSQDPIMVIDDTGTVVFWNPAAETVSGYSRTEAIGRPLHELVVPESHRSIHAKAMRGFAKTGRGPVLGRTLELTAVRKSGEEFAIELSVSAVSLGGRWHAIGVMRDVSERRRIFDLIRQSRATYQTLVDHLPQRIVYKDLDSVYISGNRSYAEDLGLQANQIPGQMDLDFFPPELAEQYRQADSRVLESGCMEEKEEPYIFRGERRERLTTRVPVRDGDGQPVGVLSISQDITDRRREERERQQLELQLHQAHKLEAVGQLAAGIAHEINTPTQFVSDNTRFLRDAVRDLVGFVQSAREAFDTAECGHLTPEACAAVRQFAEQIDLDFLATEVPDAIDSALEGLDRISEIVGAMKKFSHPGTEEKVPTDINEAIRVTAAVSRNEWKYHAELVTDLDPELPLIPVYPGELNQTLLNLIVNAAQAVGEFSQSGEKMGEIRVTTSHKGNWAEIRVKDTGCGIPEGIRARIFEPFFTTKEVGKGTGQGLAIAHSMVVDKHGGHIDVDSAEGQGSTFTVRLPIEAEISPGIQSRWSALGGHASA
jgi:two-component system, NtrC family, sensor kinase